MGFGIYESTVVRLKMTNKHVAHVNYFERCVFTRNSNYVPMWLKYPQSKNPFNLRAKKLPFCVSPEASGDKLWVNF